MLNLHLCNKVFYSIIVYVFFLVIYMCCARLHYLCFLSVRGAVVVLDCEILYIYSFNPSSVAVGLTATLEISYCFFLWNLGIIHVSSPPGLIQSELNSVSVAIFCLISVLILSATLRVGVPSCMFHQSSRYIYIYIYKFFLCILIQDTGLLVPPFSRSLIC